MNKEKALKNQGLEFREDIYNKGGENECRELLHLDHLFMDFFEIK